MITAVRYVQSGERMLHGAPLPSTVRVFYDLSASDIRRRLEAALREGREGLSIADLQGLDGGIVREAVLERLFAAEALERAFVGTEAMTALRAV